MTSGSDIDLIRNELTGEEVRVVLSGADTGGELLVMEDRWTRPGHQVPRHAHPGIEERWTVVSGAVAYRIGDSETVARAGESVVAPAGTPHSARDAGEGEVLVRIEMRPPLRWEEFVRQLFAIASEGLEDEEAQRSFDELFGEFEREIVLDPGASA